MSTLSTILKNVVRSGRLLGQCREYRAVRQPQKFPIRRNWCDYIMPDNTRAIPENEYQQQKARERCKMIKTAILVQSKNYTPAKKPSQYLRLFKFPSS
ncbi:unnamed protein product [Callosobruchus maculatus]|uniref:Uncharacterized protein n=1 Tax=Callosobruchus maculatus TaxID=64391 RepID=A0A653BIS9_CALMS|nr:unnamed protein product [Callosobruchus maculatus]